MMLLKTQVQRRTKKCSLALQSGGPLDCGGEGLGLRRISEA